MDCKPHNFSGTEGAVGLLRWLEKIESVFSMCSCPDGDRVKYASATLEGQALTWWNSTTQTMGIREAHAMPWAEFVQLLKNEYCPRDEIQKLEHEVWNHKMVGSEIEAYTARHNELAVLCPDLHAPEYQRHEHYVAGLVPEIAGLVVAGILTVYSEVVRSAHRLTNMKVTEGVLPPRGATVKAPDSNKRKWEAVGKGSSSAQPQQVRKSDTGGSSSERQPGVYAGKLPKCDRCNYHHTGPCDEKDCCRRCHKIGHQAKDCRSNPLGNRNPSVTPAPAPQVAASQGNQGKQGCY